VKYKILRKLFNTDDAQTTLIIRLMVGLVFFSEGIQKLLFPAVRGAGRFELIGLPNAEFLGAFVGAFEIVSGVLILLGLVTRFAVVPTLIIMLVAITTTKVDILMQKGVWEMLHAARTDWSMLLGSIFLMIKGGGSYSIDRAIFNKINIPE
jgi:uncharacterized membrane protein YphA (DoxX/SURF4 family)